MWRRRGRHTKTKRNGGASLQTRGGRSDTRVQGGAARPSVGEAMCGGGEGSTPISKEMEGLHSGGKEELPNTQAEVGAPRPSEGAALCGADEGGTARKRRRSGTTEMRRDRTELRGTPQQPVQGVVRRGGDEATAHRVPFPLHPAGKNKFPLRTPRESKHICAQVSKHCCAQMSAPERHLLNPAHIRIIFVQMSLR